jgi:hypothetical protein
VPCIFCIAVFAMLAGTVTTTILDQLESRLASEATTPVRRTTDSNSTTKFEFDFPVPHRPGGGQSAAARVAPVALTVYKQYGRVRIQVLTHALEQTQVELLQDRIAVVAGLQIVGRSDPQREQKVRQAIAAESTTEPGIMNTPWQASWPPRRA